MQGERVPRLQRSGPVFGAALALGPGLLAAPGTRVVVYSPAGQVTRDAIGSLLAGEGTSRRSPCFEAHQRQRAALPTPGGVSRSV